MKLEKEEFLLKLGKRVRAIRLEKGLTQAELAYTIGKNQQSVQRIEKGDFNPSSYYLYELSLGLEVPLSAITEI